MCTEVYKHQHIETGGNLFGLWTTSGSAVIHVAPGPGKNCRRTTASFHQDIEYMHRVGRFVNDNYMLCHIGEWHSHHSLSLNRPSDGDEQTVRRNFPQGVPKFLVIIANIKNRDTIKLSPYFFTDGGRRYEKAEVKVLDSEGPFSNDDKVMEQIQLGAEGGEDQENETTLVEIASHNEGSPNNTRRGQNMDSNSLQGRNARSTFVQGNQSSTTSRLHLNSSPPVVSPKPTLKSTFNSQANQSQPTSPATSSGPTTAGGVEPMDTSNTILLPPRDYEDASATSGNPTSVSPTVTPAEDQPQPDKNLNGDDKAPSEREIVLKKVHDQLKKWFGSQSESMFNFESSKNCPGAAEISFKHNRRFWMVRFPKGFPVDPTKLFCSQFQETVRFSVSRVNKVDIVEPLDNDVNILLSIKKRCDDFKCDVCNHFTKESLSTSDCSSASMQKLATIVNELANDVTMAIGQIDKLKKRCFSDSEAEITFMHGVCRWLIRFTVSFPDVPAIVHYFISEWSTQKRDVTLHGNRSCGPQALNSPEMIIKAIHNTCVCTSCSSARRKYR